VVAREKLAQRHTSLVATYHQLEIIHDLTLLLQGASDIQSVQQRALKVLTDELGYDQALVGLFKPLTQSLGDWQSHPPADDLLAALDRLALTPENGLLARWLLERRSGWWSNEEPLVLDEEINAWLGQSSWLILPLVLPENLLASCWSAVERPRQLDGRTRWWS